MRIAIGITLAIMLVVGAVLLWPRDETPTLPDVGPGLHKKSADGGEPIDAGARVQP